VPYPSYPQGMPIPYGATPAAPYPTYMPPLLPASYNPYSTVPYPQQGESNTQQQCSVSWISTTMPRPLCLCTFNYICKMLCFKKEEQVPLWYIPNLLLGNLNTVLLMFVAVMFDNKKGI
jgi:hypothetical protein